MLFFVALIVVPALAAFSFQLICYASHQKKPANSSSLKLNQQAALQNG